MIWFTVIILYLIIAAITYFKVFKDSDHDKFENIMLSLSWICVLPMYGFKKIQDLFIK